jgi:hypothetical protein
MIAKCTRLQPVSFFVWPYIVSITYFFAFAVLTPTKTYRWFKKNSGWQEAWKQMPLDKLHRRWVTDYKPKMPAKVAPVAPADVSLNVGI